jgi:hypothetical protein
VRLVAAPAVLLLALAACARGGSQTTTATPPPVQMVYPTGLVTTTQALADTSGVYAVAADSSERCCWTTDDVRFVVPVPKGASSLHLDVVMPGVPPFVGKPQSITLLNAAGKALATRSVPVGPPSSVTFPLPERNVALLPVHLRVATSAIPAKAGTGGDVRRLAIIVTNVYAR